MTDTKKGYQCTTCGKLYESRPEATSHAERHRTKPAQRLSGSQAPDAAQFVREVELRVDDTEELTLHETVGEDPPEDPESELLVEEREGVETEPTRLGDYE